jgi:hypothetical protein
MELAWERGAAHTRICRGGFGLLHMESARRSLAR